MRFPFARKRLGSEGEKLAERYLTGAGFRIVEKNYRCRFGEIDLIAEKLGELYFIEVKSRATSMFGDPYFSIRSQQSRRMGRAAEHFLMNNAGWHTAPKVLSALLVDLSTLKPKIEFIPHAFTMESE